MFRGTRLWLGVLIVIFVLVLILIYVVVVVLLRRRFEGLNGKRSIEATTSKLEADNLLIPLFILGQELDMVNYLPASKSQPPASINYEWLYAL